MNYLISIASLAFIFTITNTSQAQDYESPVGYMNYFSQQYHQVAKDQWAYTRLVARGKGARRVENKRQKLIESNRAAELAVKKTRDYQGNTELRDSVANFFHLSQIVLKEDYGKIMDMEDVADQSYDAMEALILARKIAGDKLDKASIRVMAAEKKFADAYTIELTEDNSQLSQNLEKASEVFDYYNEVYLIFFKSHKQEGYLVEAMNAADVNGMEQNKNALISTSAGGLEKLKSFKHYSSDPQLRMACENVLEFHEKEATEMMPTVIDFYVKKESFEKIQATMESKKKKEITQADVDAYNEATNEFNGAVNEFNSINNEMNAERDKLLNAWNSKVDAFLDRHVPK